MKLTIKNSYPIIFKYYYLFTKKFLLEASVTDYIKNIDSKYHKYLLEKFNLFNVSVRKINSVRFIKLYSYQFIDVCNLTFYEALNNNENVYVIEIADIAIIKKYRNKRIGTQIMDIIEELALQNKVKFIVGELQDERKDEPLEGRKNFFQKKGFSLWEDKKSRFSGWIAKKEITNG